MARYETTFTMKGRIEKFGIVFKKGVKKYNIADHKLNKFMYSLDYSYDITKEFIEERCEFLNKYDNAKIYTIGKDINGTYYVMYKTTGSVFISIFNGICYNDISNLPYFQRYHRVKEGCKTLEEAQALRKIAYKQHELIKNRGTLELVE